ncbi:MAG: cytochrome d ubiquinol oxidase subunit II [Kofleriaceae bacterium]
MATAWFVLLAFMLVMYIVLDGFDLGAGIVHLWIARDDRERRQVFAAIGPVWDGNEVWLIAAGGLMVFAFPRAYAVAFSGFYLPLMMVLWLFVLRGLSIELRSHHENALWRQFFDVVFAGASLLLALVFGAALGNVVRGVPIDETGYFIGPLFTDFTPSDRPGALDWYTVTIGVMAIVVLAAHGARYLEWKLAGELSERAARFGRIAWLAGGGLAAIVAIETAIVRPALFGELGGRPLAWVFIVAAIASLAYGLRTRELAGFVASCVTVASLLATVAVVVFPHVLVSSVGEQWNLDTTTAANGHDTLALGLVWWIPAILLALGYFVYVFRSFRGKVSLD